MVTIRALRADDSEQVLALNALAQPMVARLDRRELGRLMAHSDAHLVAVDERGVVAYVLVFRGHDAYDGEEFAWFVNALARSFLYIDQVVVDERARGQGIGRELYGALERMAVTEGAAALCCEVNTRPANPGSLEFHRRLGLLAQAELATADGRDVVLLAKRLDAAPAPG